MAGKALIVAIEKYPSPADELYAPLEEMDRWARLLASRKYGFDSIRCLSDDHATKPAVLKAFGELLQGAAEDDRIMFIFLGHGCLSRVLNGPGRHRKLPQHALLAYPPDPKDLRSGAITDSEFAQHIRDAKLPAGVHFSIVLDCCFGGDFRIGTFADEKPGRTLFAHLPGDDISESEMAAARPFGALFELAENFERPIIFAACERRKRAYEAIIDGTWRMLMSKRAIEELAKNPDQPQRLTYAELRDAINPLHPHYDQRATIVGDVDLQDQPFGGARGTAEKAAALALQLSRNVASGGVVQALDLRVEGICCYLDAGNSPLQKRLVMPHDPRTTTDRHIAFVEIAQDDIGRYTGEQPSDIYQHEAPVLGLGTVSYYRWDLSGHRIEIVGAATGALQLTSGFNHHLPRMTAILPELRLTPDDRCFDSSPPTDLLAAHFDIAAGTLDCGPLTEDPLEFDPPRNWPSRREPTYTWLQVPLAMSPARVRIMDVTGAGRDAEIVLKAGTSSIRIGNAQELDIIGPGSGENPADHFHLYYTLSDPETFAMLPRPLPLPKKPQVPINGCSNTGWP